MVLFNSEGQQFGLLSGGCLESDIKLNARKVMQDNQPRFLTYDDNDEDDISFKLGVGCGGIVHLALLPLNQENHYLQLDSALAQLEANKPCLWEQELGKNSSFSSCIIKQADRLKQRHATLESTDSNLVLKVPLSPPPHILIVGGGLDAFHVTRLASQTGWQTSIWDPRPAQARRSHFPFVDNIIDDESPASLPALHHQRPINALILMSHSKTIDAQALQALCDISFQYIGILGPAHRRNEVLIQAGVRQNEPAQIIAGPLGLDIGGDLPESIAISAIAECHAALYQRSAKSISNVLTAKENNFHDRV